MRWPTRWLCSTAPTPLPGSRARTPQETGRCHSAAGFGVTTYTTRDPRNLTSRLPTTGRRYRPNSVSRFHSRRSTPHTSIIRSSICPTWPREPELPPTLNRLRQQPACRRRRLSVATGWPPPDDYSIPHANDDFSFRGAILQRGDRGSGFLQRVDHRLGRGQLARGEQPLEVGPLLGQRIGVRAGPGAPADTDDVNVVQQQSVDLHGRDLSAGEADDQQTAPRRQRAQRIGEPVAADG